MLPVLALLLVSMARRSAVHELVQKLAACVCFLSCLVEMANITTKRTSKRASCLKWMRFYLYVYSSLECAIQTAVHWIEC